MARGARVSSNKATSDGWTVRGLLLVALSSGVAATLVVGLVGALALQESTESVDSVSDHVAPAQLANAQFIRYMVDADTDLRAYLVSGERQLLDDHRAALVRVGTTETDLSTYARGLPDMADLVARQEQAADVWVRDFARPAIAAGPAAAAADSELLDLGVRLFDAVEELNAIIAKRLRTQLAAARSVADHRLDLAVGLMVVAGLLGALVSGIIGWRVTRSARGSLAEIEDVVERLAGGNYDARAPLTGPPEIRRVEAAVNQMAEEIARARDVELEVQAQLLEIDRVKSDFVANVSHELRTPLTSIAGYLELLAEDLRDEVDPAHVEMMTVMQRNVARLRSLIEDLLDLGRLEHQPERLESVDVSRLVNDVAEEQRLSASSRAVTLSVDVDGTPVRVIGDPAQLQRAVANLVSNAVKFSHDGGDVRVHLALGDEHAEISVSDEGIGIPVAEQTKVGERFFRASNAVTAHIPGTGLGLRMVQTIVSNHRGTFGLSSREGRGTTATLRLPLQRVPASAQEHLDPVRR